jgi:hypothetical protein
MNASPTLFAEAEFVLTSAKKTTWRNTNRTILQTYDIADVSKGNFLLLVYYRIKFILLPLYPQTGI